MRIQTSSKPKEIILTHFQSCSCILIKSLCYVKMMDVLKLSFDRLTCKEYAFINKQLPNACI